MSSDRDELAAIHRENSYLRNKPSVRAGLYNRFLETRFPIEFLGII